MKNTLKFTLTAMALVAGPLAVAETADCVKVTNSVRAAVEVDPSRVTEIVASSIAANGSCACEVVKAAITASNADKGVVADIVEAAVLESPADARMIAQCAIATAPDAVSSIQAVIEKYDAAGGDDDYSAKEALPKGGLDDGKGVPTPVADGPNPLDYPFDSINDPIGFPGNEFWLPPFFFPPVEGDPNVTEIGDGDYYEGS